MHLRSFIFFVGGIMYLVTDQKGKKVYLYTENAKRLIELLKEKNIEMSVLRFP
mgnify:CR=1 FL=1